MSDEKLKIKIVNGVKYYEMTEEYLNALKRLERKSERQKCEKENRRLYGLSKSRLVERNKELKEHRDKLENKLTTIKKEVEAKKFAFAGRIGVKPTYYLKYEDVLKLLEAK